MGKIQLVGVHIGSSGIGEVGTSCGGIFRAKPEKYPHSFTSDSIPGEPSYFDTQHKVEFNYLTSSCSGIIAMTSLDFDNFIVSASSKSISKILGGYILDGADVSLLLPVKPKRYYRHGWQSWSLTAWLDVDLRLPVQKPALLHPMQTDPLYVEHLAPNGSWLGAVELDDGRVLLLGALGLESHVALHGRKLHGWCEANAGDWYVACGSEAEVFSGFTKLLKQRLGASPVKPNPRVWCSWYSLYTAIDEPLLNRIFDDLGDLPFDVLQVDDGWQTSIGDWQPNSKFPSGMDALADKIKSTGRQAGLWLAPLIAVRSSHLFRQHPEWFLRDLNAQFVSAGFNWGEPLYALDTTNLEVLDWLRNLMQQVRAWGFDYLKLDFLYAGALPGKHRVDTPREAAYRKGLRVMREAMNEDAYLLACGAPILPSLGICDALRVGPDVAGEWESFRDAVLLCNPTNPGTKNAIRTTINRLWLKPLTAVDPDVVYFQSQHNTLTRKQKRLLQDMALICDFKATSDLPQRMTADERENLLAFLEARLKIERTSRYSFLLDGRTVDFSPAMLLAQQPRGFNALASTLLGWLAEQRWTMRLFNRLWKRELTKMLRGL